MMKRLQICAIVGNCVAFVLHVRNGFVFAERGDGYSLAMCCVGWFVAAFVVFMTLSARRER